MGISSRLFRLPRPRTFLYLMSLRTGTELITLSLLLNKLSGLYGLLAILTGISLSPLQLSMYLYSVVALVLTAFLAPHVRKQSPFQCLALAWFYILDSAINGAYTAAFAFAWFLALSEHHSESSGSAKDKSGSSIYNTAGFTSPELNVSHVDVVGTPASGITAGQDAVAIGSPGSPAASASSPSLGHGVLQPESLPSILIISGLWAVRLYFILVVMAYARSVLRAHSYSASTSGLFDRDAANPFAPSTPEGQGWKGKLGRAMTAIGREYWLGSEEENSWQRGLGGKFRKSGDVGGPVERERRRRSGTGPPMPASVESLRANDGR
ncbi:MAG: hypothetical protein M1825_004373 [Sarcosagium campestre]|nr:MAG: hypothetical protein M1825_004373 [Sarcosagium campestre]